MTLVIQSCDFHFQMFFKPGIENIRNNLGPDSVTDDHIKGMCRTILEEAKVMYPVYANSNPSQNCNNRSAIDGNDVDYPNSHSQTQIKQEDVKPPITVSREQLLFFSLAYV